MRFSQWLFRRVVVLAGAFGLAAACAVGQPEEIAFPVGNALLSVQTDGSVVGIQFPEGETDFNREISNTKLCVLEVPGGVIYPAAITANPSKVGITFTDGSQATLAKADGRGFTIFRLSDLDLRSSATGMQMFRVPVPTEARINPTLNTAFHEGKAFGIMSATPEILAITHSSESRVADLKGCSHTLKKSEVARQGRYAAEFTSTCTLDSSGWSMQGKPYRGTIERDSVAGITAWVHGDGKSQSLKFQLTDDGGGATDYYVPINFTGWRQVSVLQAAHHDVQGKHVTGLNLYYNGIPAKTSVSCLIDDIRLMQRTDETTQSTLLEDFEAPESAWWNDGTRNLGLHWEFRYAAVGDAFGVIACPETSYFDVMKDFEKSAGILTPYIDGQWNKRAAAVNESYLFLTAYSENQFEQAMAMAKRGGFKRVLLEQHSWCKSTGHYEINTKNFADGLAGLRRTVQRFRDEGIEVGLHLLGASIDNNDPYLTPMPDERLVKDAQTTLTKALDAVTTTITVASMPSGFPSEDGGYTGDGTILQIGSELIQYESRTTSAPYVFRNCVRGYLGTSAAVHTPEETVFHLARSYGYHMMDLDTSLLDEVTSNFAAVANACEIDMVYFDGSERLQGEHQRYNGRLINSYVSKLKNPNILVQASSFSHFSWHQLARTASADGHGDLKGYLEQRSPSFKTFKQTGLPLDIGWYYGYDTSATPDMYEYILGTTIGYDSSFSFQVSVDAAKKHPFTDDILDLTRRYEELRLSGRVPEEMKKRLQVPEELAGKAPDDPARDNTLRRDYRFMKIGENEAFQRVLYGEWREATSTGTEWQLLVNDELSSVGVQLQVLGEDSTKKLDNPWFEINGQRLTWRGGVLPGHYVFLWPGEPGIMFGPNGERAISAVQTPVVSLSKGTHTVKFGSDGGEVVPVRVRTVALTPEHYIIP